jgi:hypothetical protein
MRASDNLECKSGKAALSACIYFERVKITIMAIYFLMGVTIVLAGVAGLQLFYMGYLERLSKEQRRRINELEKQCSIVSRRLTNAEDTLAHQADVIQSMEYYDDAPVIAAPEEEEVWADVIDSE